MYCKPSGELAFLFHHMINAAVLNLAASTDVGELLLNGIRQTIQASIKPAGGPMSW
jgi:hypothetical protein